MRSLILRAFIGLSLFLQSGLAIAGTSLEGDKQKTLGAPFDWQNGLTSAADSIKVNVDWFYRLLTALIIVITLFVLALLAIVILRFRRNANPTPSRRSHNVPLEILWTLIPLIIVLAMLFPSLKLMYYMDKAKHPEMTVKVTGHQWYWGYEYPDLGIDEYPSNLIPKDKLAQGQLRLLSVDEPLVIPVDTEIQFLVTGADVIHSWMVPSFGINRSGIPGRTNESWAKVTHEGVFYGQCSKICGINHGYMPIEVHVISKDAFKQWAAIAKASGTDKANAAILGTKTASAN
jgi:cytochrome c oxidase subunit 2